MTGLGASATTRTGQLATIVDRTLAAKAERQPQAPYPPSEWDKAAFMADSAQDRLLQKYGPVRYQAYLNRSTKELAAYRPDWRLFVGLGCGAVAAFLLFRRSR